MFEFINQRRIRVTRDFCHTFQRQVIGDLPQMAQLTLQHSDYDPNPVGDLFTVLDRHQFSQLFAQLVVQFLTTAHRRSPLVVKQPNYAVCGEQ